jgi:protein-S-isoprenylcysteine O-methyltransferase Ste14
VAILIAWLNLLILIVSAGLFLFFYVKSASPAQLEAKIGEGAYRKCMYYRILASTFETITIVNYIVYRFYPLPIGLPLNLPWPFSVSVLLAACIAVPSLYLMYIGMRDAGRETLEPRKDHTMYAGVYNKMRHPQALGESFLWFPVALLLDSPFLVLFSFVWIPILYVMCVYEERDLLVRYGQAYADYRERVGILPRSSSE